MYLPLPVFALLLVVLHVTADRTPPLAFQEGKGPGALESLKRIILRGVPGGLLIGLTVLGGIGISRAPPGTFQTYNTAGEIPARAFTEHVVLNAEVVRVTDGDTLRVRHTPLVDLWGTGQTGTGKNGRQKLTEETMIIRLAGVDAPETKKRDSPGQPYSEEAKEFVSKRLLNRKVRVKLLRRDQYQRAVATVEYGAWPIRKSISEELVREGLAVVYRQGGAEYDGKLRLLEDLEAQARVRRRGLWSASKVQLPSEYKATQKGGGKAAAAAKVPPSKGPVAKASASKAAAAKSASKGRAQGPAAAAA